MLAAAATSALLLGACAASAASGNGPQIDAQPGTTGSSRTVGVSPSHPSTTTSTTTTLPAEPVITDNRVYLVGDSITESISSRYSGAVCDALNPLGWDVTVDAVMGRQTADAVQSLRAHLGDVGQVMVVLIGHNDGIDPTSYKAQLDRLIALVPDVRRIYLLTNYQFEKGRDRMNAVLQQEAAADGTGGPDDRIELVDWNTVVSGVKGAIRQDGLHLTSIGQEALAGTIASALGLAPGATAAHHDDHGGQRLDGQPAGDIVHEDHDRLVGHVHDRAGRLDLRRLGLRQPRLRRLGVRRLRRRLRRQRQDDDHGRAGARADDVTRLEPVGHGRAAHLQAGQAAGLDDRTARDQPARHEPAGQQPAGHHPAGDEPTGHLRPAGARRRLLRRVRLVRFGAVRLVSGPRPRGRRARRGRGSGCGRGSRR